MFLLFVCFRNSSNLGLILNAFCGMHNTLELILAIQTCRLQLWCHTSVRKKLHFHRLRPKNQITAGGEKEKRKKKTEMKRTCLFTSVTCTLPLPLKTEIFLQTSLLRLQ